MVDNGSARKWFSEESGVRYRFWQAGWGRWVLFILGWTILSLLFVPETYLYFLYRGEGIPWNRTIALTFANAGIAFIFLPPIVWLTRRFPVEQRHWRKALLVHIPACVIFSLSHSWLYAALCYASPVFHALFLRFHPNLLTYWAIVGFTQAVDYFQRYKERERQLAKAELHLLKAQLQPHFLFNTLHTISAMMHEDVAGADRMVNRLSDLLRLTLQSIGEHEVPLRQELEFLKSYLEIERIRFQERLALTLDIEPATLDALVPSMLLQPLAENSIRHGFGANLQGGSITLQAQRQEDRLVLRFEDNGRGFPGLDPQLPEPGLGLTNTRRRLEQLYASANHLQLESLPGGGAVVSLEIPFHTAPAQESGVIAESMADENSSADRRRRALGAPADRYVAQS
jgi:two-component system LytT family sensor kinase